VAVALALATGLLGTASATSAEEATPGPVTIATGLHNPRQMTFSQNGSLYVAEAGTGKLGASDQSGTCEEGPEGPSCAGNTSSVTRIGEPWGKAKTSRPITGLLSFAGPDGTGATGVDAVAFDGSILYGIETYGPPSSLPTSVANQNGKLLRLRRDGTKESIVDIASFALAHPPAGHEPDSDPYGLLIRGNNFYVADAASNALYNYKHHTIETIHTFEARPADPFDGVPTSIAEHNGRLYVGQLSSLNPGAAKVTVLSKSGTVLRTYTGLSSVTGVAVARNGDIYATEVFTGEPFNSPGALVKIPADGGPRVTTTLPTPGGVAVDRHGNVYVSINSVTPDGSVIRIANSSSDHHHHSDRD